MGLADAGTPLSHEETMKWAPHVREHGIAQFINLYKKTRNRKGDAFKWGDEIEYTLVKFDENNQEVKLCLRSEEVLAELKVRGDENADGLWTPEWGAFMIEGTPSKPFEGLNLGSIEENMRKRRREVKTFLKSDEDLMCITSFPRMGCDNFTFPTTKPTPNEGMTRSIFFPDACVFPGHPRYRNTTTNIMGRRGEKPYYNLPIFKDKHTKIPVDDCYKYEKNALADHVYLDSMGFGCGYSCIQVTFQAQDLNEARILYDQMAPFVPIMMALTASAPFHRGYITDVDHRWNVLCGTQDCRTAEEKGLAPLRKNKFAIKKSRHDSINCYLSPEGARYNDETVLYHTEDYERLVDSGIDHILAQHIAHLFIRDTISMFKEKIHQSDEDVDHFENIQSTVWQSMRLKPPPLNASTGWRVEFRPCDVQFTDFENAAVVCFLVLLTRIIVTYKLNFLIPISKVDENVQRAQKRNAVLEQKFWFRRIIRPNESGKNKENKNAHGKIKDPSYMYEEILMKERRRSSLKISNELNIMKNGIFDYKKLVIPKLDTDNSKSKANIQENEYVGMSLNEIINGKNPDFPGVIPLMRKYLNETAIDTDSHRQARRYLRLIEDRASGKTLTAASWMRKFATSHPDYRRDSVMTGKMNYDLLKRIQAIQNGELYCSDLLGECSKDEM